MSWSPYDNIIPPGGVLRWRKAHARALWRAYPGDGALYIIREVSGRYRVELVYPGRDGFNYLVGHEYPNLRDAAAAAERHNMERQESKMYNGTRNWIIIDPRTGYQASSEFYATEDDAVAAAKGIIGDGRNTADLLVCRAMSRVRLASPPIEVTAIRGIA